MAKIKLQPPKVRKAVSSKELSADAPDADKAPVRPDNKIPALQRILANGP